METDALLIMALSVHVGHQGGWWVLLSGLARYLLAGAQALWPALRRLVAARRWRKVVAALQGSVLLAAASALLPGWLTVGLLGLGVGLLDLRSPPRWSSGSRGGSRPPPGRRGERARRGAALRWRSPLRTATGTSRPGWWRGCRWSCWCWWPSPSSCARWADLLALVLGGLAGALLALKAVNVGFTLVLTGASTSSATGSTSAPRSASSATRSAGRRRSRGGRDGRGGAGRAARARAAGGAPAAG
ncbi:MAG: hypothetical protein R2731_05000 [Nocardioides sp.]